MPIYEYRCLACDKVFEEIHQHADDIMEEPCPTCGKGSRRVISNTTFVLKGGGWYVTEYGNKKKTGSAAGTAKEAASSDTSTESTSTESPKTADTVPPAPAAAPAPPSAQRTADASAMAS